jgi:hypothetical protein
MDISPPSWAYMKGIARRIAPGHPQRWDDMIQEGYELWVKCAQKYDPAYGIPAKNFIKPFIVHQMRRAMRRDAAASLGTSLASLQTGGGVERRRTLDAEIYPHGVDSLANPEAMTSEEAVIAIQEVWRMKRAIWDAAHEMGVPYKRWQNAYFRGCILTERVRPEDIKERFDVKSGSLSFFRSRLYKLAKERL